MSLFKNKQKKADDSRRQTTSGDKSVYFEDNHGTVNMTVDVSEQQIEQATAGIKEHTAEETDRTIHAVKSSEETILSALSDLSAKQDEIEKAKAELESERKAKEALQAEYERTVKEMQTARMEAEQTAKPEEECERFIESLTASQEQADDGYPTLKNYYKAAFEISGTELRRCKSFRVKRDAVSGDKKVKVPFGITTICNRAFYDCTDVESIELPYGVTIIANNAFARCGGLTSIAIPNTVTSIGWHIFDYDDRLTSINFAGTKAQWKAIKKDKYWKDNSGKFTIYCTDGKIRFP